MSLIKLKIYRDQRGQTLIETLVAAFMLTMGVTAASGLAIYAFSSSTNITKQIIGAGLAREGIEAVKNMRDTNWLKDTLVTPTNVPVICSDTGCYNYPDACTTASCYKNWLSQYYTLSAQSYVLTFDPTITKIWKLLPETTNFGLDLDVNNIGNPSFAGFYKPNQSASFGSSDYYRKITLSLDTTTVPFNVVGNDYGRLKVQSQVWWTDKKCPRTNPYTFDSAPTACKLELDYFLTNWKNY